MAEVEGELGNVMKAIKAGIITASTKSELETLELRKETISQQIAANSASIPVIPNDLAEIYKGKVSQLVDSLNNPAIRLQATDALRGLVEKVIVGWNAKAKTHTVELVGELAALLGFGTNEDAAAYSAAASSLKMVAGARNQRYLRLLETRLSQARTNSTQMISD